MAEGNVTSGNTENHEPERPLYIHIDNIYDEWHDEEMNQYVFDFYTYAGQNISLRLKKKDIERINLYMRKADADKKYLDHIINN